MLIIEFIGPPYSGKSFYKDDLYENLKKKNIDTKDYNFPCSPKDFSSSFDIKSDTGSFVQDVRLNIKAPQENREFSFQIKANSPEKAGGGNLKFEATLTIVK